MQPILFRSHLTDRNLVNNALAYAEGAHGEQKRKYTGEPYFNHCRNVAAYVSHVTNDSEVVAAAALHDTIEDTPATFTDILAAFGPRVARLVLEVTDASKKADGNRATRKAIDRAHLARSSREGATIKLADLVDNSRNIMEHDMGFAKIYIPEKRALLSVLEHGNADLWLLADTTLRRCEASLSMNTADVSRA